MQHIYLSPHFDDAALSCGGAIARHGRVGEATVVVTLFGGKPDYRRLSPFARSIHARPDAGADPIDARLTEEHEALAILGAQSQTYPYLDCIYRQDASGKRWLYDSEEAIFGPVDTADDGLVDKLGRDLMALAATPDSCRIYAPLAIGNHVDHQIAHLSARRLHDAGYTTFFYEDYPYVVRDPANLEETLARWDERSQWQPEIIALDDTDLQRKAAAICAYRSQLGVLFSIGEHGELAAVEAALLDFAEKVAQSQSHGRFAERLWRLEPKHRV